MVVRHVKVNAVVFIIIYGQGGQGLVHDEGDLDVVVRGQGAVADDVDVHLVELAEAALLGALAPPDLLSDSDRCIW